MVENAGMRTAFFGSSFPFTEPATTAFDTQAERDMIINPLVDKMMGTTLANQPNQTDIRPVLNTLIDELTTGCTARNLPGHLHPQRRQGRLLGGALQRRSADPLRDSRKDHEDA